MTLIRTVLLISILLAPGSGAEDVYSVCQILARLQDFNCRSVRVRARLEPGLGTWLVGENCSKPIKVNTVVFQDLIALAWPTSLQVGCKVDFNDDEKSGQDLEGVLGKYQPKKQRIDIIVDGVVETRSPAYGLVGKQGQRIGFGHLGMAPAQIIVKRVVNVKVTPIK